MLGGSSLQCGKGRPATSCIANDVWAHSFRRTTDGCSNFPTMRPEGTRCVGQQVGGRMETGARGVYDVRQPRVVRNVLVCRVADGVSRAVQLQRCKCCPRRLRTCHAAAGHRRNRDAVGSMDCIWNGCAVCTDAQACGIWGHRGRVFRGRPCCAWSHPRCRLGLSVFCVGSWNGGGVSDWMGGSSLHASARHGIEDGRVQSRPSRSKAGNRFRSSRIACGRLSRSRAQRGHTR